MDFKLINPKPMHKNTLRGFFTLCLGPVEISGWTYHVKGEKSWVSPPSRPYQDKESGEQKYAPIVRIPSEDRYWNFQNWAKVEAEELFKEVAPPARDPEPAYTEDEDSRPF